MKNKIILIFAAFLLFTTACEDTPFDELNIDPTSLSGVELRLILPEIITSSMFNEGNGGNRAIGIIMQQFIGLDAQQLQYTDYVLGEDLLNNYWRTGLYAGVLRSCDVLIKQAIEEGNKFYEGVGKVAMANQYGITTSWFGDIPFSQALLGTENLKPEYDSQEQVYAGVIAMLDDAISILSANPQDHGGGDLIYGGDATGWLKTAKALKARYLIHQAKQKGDGAFTAALGELSGSYQSLSEQSDFTFGTAETQNYSLAKFGIERPSTLGIDPRFAAMMDGDGRQEKYMQDVDGTWLFHNGTEDLTYTRNDATIPMISYCEVKFMEAEAKNKLSPGADANAALKEAIMASFDQSGASGGEAYADAVIAGGVDQETIMTEAYKAYYGFAFHETWANWRRTGIPALTPSPDGANGFNPSGAVPQRFIYVESETQTNSENVAAARAAQSGGLLDVPVWAFK